MPPPGSGGGEMELTAAACALLKETAQTFHGARRRRFIAETVEAFGLSQRQAQLQLSWSRDTVRKALHEFHSGITCLDNFSARGRKRNALMDIDTPITDPGEHVQADDPQAVGELFVRYGDRL